MCNTCCFSPATKFRRTRWCVLLYCYLPQIESKKIKLAWSTPWRNVRVVEVWLHSFLTSTLDGSEWSVSRPSRCTLHINDNVCHKLCKLCKYLLNTKSSTSCWQERTKGLFQNVFSYWPCAYKVDTSTGSTSVVCNYAALLYANFSKRHVSKFMKNIKRH
jgi:hypothetical protein